ncbi:phosphoinositide-3-kinase-interacting protein 1-like isoform X2 [Cynoglossus semilaevis]|uniref:phosphoinositide-3-kinase-interacting protein 1-like isoform X2 n=1 Tax=Cynoglossus semilaevis TaxID=244447 RepID=UPI0007DC8FAE|nr:phosphoinositide-3-kinase-interacting protein 1-like isoform X2 [Cynoglossus semilaevis]
MSWVTSASQLCTMFLSLHAVFLCAVAMVESSSGNEQEAEALNPSVAGPLTESFQPAQLGGSQGEVAALRPVVGISQRVQTGSKKKKDLGTLGYVFGILIMAVIIILGVGITLGYFYKRGRDLRKQHDQRVHEREMQRITLPLSAFSNSTCELVDENTIMIIAEQDTTPAQKVRIESGDSQCSLEPLKHELHKLKELKAVVLWTKT